MNSVTLKAICALSNKVNQMNQRLDEFFNERADENKQSAADAQNATIELELDVDQRLADIENALCEISEGE